MIFSYFSSLLKWPWKAKEYPSVSFFSWHIGKRMKMLACQLNSIGWLQMNTTLLEGQGCLQAEAGSTTALHINEWCTADEMQINLSSGQQARSRKKPRSLLETHHFPCLHFRNVCHFFKKISNKRLVSMKEPPSYREDFDLSKQLSNSMFWRQNQLQGFRCDENFYFFIGSFQNMFIQHPKYIWLTTFMSTFWHLECWL